MNARLNRLFAADGKCFDVAVDHGFFGEGSFLTGIENMAKTVATLRWVVTGHAKKPSAFVAQ